MAGWVLGTGHYLAPEVASGQPATVQADLYSLGVVLYRMLTGRLPFEGDEPLAVALLHRTQPPPRPSVYHPGFPASLEAVILRLLEKDSARRFPSALAVTAALESGAVAALVVASLADATTRLLPQSASLSAVSASRATTTRPGRQFSGAVRPCGPGRCCCCCP